MPSPQVRDYTSRVFRILSTFASVVLFFIIGGSNWAEEAPTRRPNIILVLADNVGYGDLACLGNPIVETPNIDHFRGECVRFTNFHVSPAASPTWAALLTGRHEFRSGVTSTTPEGERIRRDAVNIAQVLKSAGYATGIFGQWRGGDEGAYRPDKRGFDETFVVVGDAIEAAPNGTGGRAPDHSYFDPAILDNGTVINTFGYATDILFSRAIEWMDEKIDGGTSYFACIVPSADHEPLACPPEFERRYTGRVPANVATFFGMITNLDANFGRLLGKLDEWGYEGNTLVIFLTDHGGSTGVNVFNAGMRGGKGSAYEGGARVPSFWRWPKGWAGGADVSALTAHLDIFPTLAHLAGAKIPDALAAKLEGRDLSPLLENPIAEWPDRLLFTHVGQWAPGTAAQSKYVNCSARDSRFALVNNGELYDLVGDPGQATDVLQQHPAELEKLRAAYEKWWAEIQADLVRE